LLTTSLILSEEVFELALGVARPRYFMLLATQILARVITKQLSQRCRRAVALSSARTISPKMRR
jgi:hypothetical protein